MATNNQLKQVSLYEGGSPQPITLPSYSMQAGNLVGGATVTAPLTSPTANLVTPNPLSYAANVMPVGAAAGSGNSGGVTDEGVVTGNPNVNNTTFNNNGVGAASPVNLSYSANAGDAPAATPMSASADTGAAPEGTTGATETPAPEAPENPTTEQAGTYYDYLKDEVPESLQDIYNDEIAYQDQQNAQLVEDINGLRETGIENAGEIRNTAYENAETQKETTYTYADKVLMETLGFNEEQYQYLIDSINSSKETGLALAEDVRATLLALATETRDQIYKAAEAARVREYEQAEIVRQRGIVDASNAFEQNKATYGSNAEALASMGLTGGGYSDYLNAQAYAAQRGEVQAVNADAEATKRAARYAEDDKKMNADTTYAANVKEAELNYSEQVGKVNETYDAAMRDANLWKSEADFAANRENTDTKYAADSAYNAAIGDADATYAANVADVNYQADLAIAEANAATAQAKHEAEQKLKEGLLTNEQAVAQYKEEMFYHFLEKAGAGNYTAEQLEAIADRLELDDTQKQELIGALNKYNADVAAAEEAKKTGYFTELLTYANNGAYTAEQLAKLGNEYGLSDTQIADLQSAATSYKTNLQNERYNQLLGAADTDGFATIDAALSAGEITQAQHTALKAQYQKYYYDLYSSAASSDFGTVNTSTVDSEFKAGHLTQAQYDDIKAKYNASVASAITASSIFYASGVALSEDQAKAIVNDLKATGWLTSTNSSALDSKLSSAYAEEDDGGGCYAAGTLISTLNGEKVAVEDLKVGDYVLVFNHFKGGLDISPISYIFHEEEKEHKALYLNFDNKASIEIIYGHGFFDVTLNKYVLLNVENAAEYVGHNFYHITLKDGLYEKEIVTLTDYEVREEKTECYSVLTAQHVNCVANDILTVTDDGNRPAALLKGFYDMFELDEAHAYKNVAHDMAKYGVFTYDDWKDYVTEDVYEAFNGPYLKIAIGKGLTTFDEIVGYINKFINQ